MSARSLQRILDLDYRIPRHYVSFKKDENFTNSSSLNHKFDNYKDKLKLKRENYLDPLVKQAKAIPGPGQYKFNSSFQQSSQQRQSNRINSERQKKASSAGKDKVGRATDLDSYIKSQQFLPSPGIYQPPTSDFEIYQDFQQQENGDPQKLVRQFDLDDNVYLAATNPGPGDYNPQKEVKKIKVDKTTPADWVKKHSSRSPGGQGAADYVGVGKYNPINVNLVDSPTFDLMNYQNRAGSKSKSPSTQEFVNGPGLGGFEQRFFDGVTKQIPVTFQHNQVIQWYGQQSNKNAKDNRGIQLFTSEDRFSQSPPKRSIYYDGSPNLY